MPAPRSASRSTALAVLAAAAIAGVPGRSLDAQGRAPAAPAAPGAKVAPLVPLAPPAAPAGRYGFTIVDDDGDRTTGTVSWQGALARIDVVEGDLSVDFGLDGDDRRERRERRRTGGRTGTRSWLLVDRTRGMLHIVKDDERLIEEVPVADFEGLVTRVLGYVTPMVDIAVSNAGIVGRDLGDGGAVAGVPTRHFRFVERYDQTVRAMGFRADAGRVTVTTDVRVPTTVGLPPNPLATMVLSSTSAAMLFDARHRGEVARARAALYGATPAQVDVVVEKTDDGRPSRETTSVTVTSISSTPPDAARLVLPAGYARKRISFGPGRRSSSM